jgi:hypothetical protein
MSGKPFEPYDATQDLTCWKPGGLAVAALIAAALLVACSDAKTVSFYKDHAPERSKKVGECLATPSQSQDCINARQADFEVSGIKAVNGRAVAPGQ